MWENAGGRVLGQVPLQNQQGVENMTDDEARAMRAEDLDCHRRDLREAIDRGDPPAWRVEVQLMPLADAAGYRFNPFDVTKVWPHADYPTITVGRMVLDRNPENFFAQIVQAGFDVANMVPGSGRARTGWCWGDLRLRRLPALPQRHQPRPAAGQPAGGRGAQLQQGRSPMRYRQ